MRSVMKRLMISSVLALTLATSAPSSALVLTGYVADSAMVDSLIAGVDSLLYERRILQIDLGETRRIARVDSLAFEERLDIYRARERSGLIKILTHPSVWFCVGVYAGLRVTR